MISAKILADSINPQGDRLTTMEIVMPRIVLAEFNTHRLFSRNSASSRAIPFNKMVKMVEENPFIPLAVQYDHKGMQGTSYFNERDYEAFVASWLNARDFAIRSAQQLHSQGATKQLCNRLLEPFMYHKVIVTSSEWENFFKLRTPSYVVNWYPSNRPEAVEPSQATFMSKKDAIEMTEGECKNWTEKDWRESNISQADIHIQAVAECMWDVMSGSTPKKLQPGEYHLPFGDGIDLSHSSFDSFKHADRGLTNEELQQLMIKVSVARCARISYETLGDNPKIDYEADIRLHDILVESGHASPTEHVARCMTDEEYVRNIKGQLWDDKFEVPVPKPEAEGWSRNFRGFIQYRELINL